MSRGSARRLEAPYEAVSIARRLSRDRHGGGVSSPSGPWGLDDGWLRLEDLYLARPMRVGCDPEGRPSPTASLGSSTAHGDPSRPREAAAVRSTALAGVGRSSALTVTLKEFPARLSYRPVAHLAVIRTYDYRVAE